MRGEATRHALIRAAIEVFGRDGYKAATTQEIARLADANPALVSYYYGGKEGLYRAVVEHIARRIEARIEPIAERTHALMRELEAGRVPAALRERRCLDLLFDVLDGCADVLADRESAGWARIVLHEQLEPTEAFETLYAAERGLLDVMTLLVAAMRGGGGPSTEDKLAVIGLLGEALVVRSAKGVLLRYLGWPELRTEQVAELKRRLRRNAVVVLRAGRDARS
jgi:AcrR family transcriptional regulator